MKKDINEFSDILQHEANAIASATAQQVSKQANMLQHLISTSQEEDKEEVLKEKDSQISKNSTEAESLNIGDKLKDEDKPENENKPEKMAEDSSNYFGFGGFMKQIVSTVQRLSSEDTTKDEDEFTQELKLPGRKTALDQVYILIIILWSFPLVRILKFSAHFCKCRTTGKHSCISRLRTSIYIANGWPISISTNIMAKSICFFRTILS